MRRPPQFAPRELLSAAELNRIVEEVVRQSRITATPPLVAVTGPNGIQLTVQPDEMYAIITAYSPCGSASSSSSSASSSSSSSGSPGKTKYKVREAYMGSSGVFSVMPNGRCGYGYELNNNAVPSGSVVIAAPGKADNEWSFQYGGGGGAAGGGFPARIKTSALSDGLVLYTVEEIETDPVTLLPRAKSGGRSGAAYRGPTEDIDPPPIPVGEGVWATESATVAGAYEITSWGGQFRITEEVLTGVEGDAIPNPSNCDEFLVTILEYYQNRRLSAREICGAFSPAGEGESGGG